jgi:hypothetical protein
MTRLFSIAFDFEGGRYTAMVNMWQQAYDLHCRVNYTDKTLRSILPTSGFEFSLAEGLKQPKELPNELAKSLVASTTDAITNYLQKEQNY